MTTDLSSLRLHARFDEGEGPAIVMLHGINSDGGDWRVVIDTIGPGYRFIAFDLLGFGESPKPLDIEYSADEHALVIESTLLDLAVDDPFLLVGYSLGGDIALRYASTYPERVRRLFLLDAPFYLPPELVETKQYGLKLMYENVSTWLWGLLASSKQKDSVLYKVATGAGEAALKDAFHAQDIPTHWEIMSKNLTNTVNAATWVDDLPKLTMPVTHAIGVRDAIVRVSQTPALKRLKPDLEIRRIYGLAADHMTLWNMPETVAAEIMRDEVRELHVAWRGGTGAPLLILHGFESTAEAWKPIAEVLARTNDVAVVDLLGAGDSPAPQSLHYTLADHSAAVLGTVEALWGSATRVRFVGDGLGATVALACAAGVPARSAGVVAFSPALLEPGATLETVAHDERSARVVALRDLAKRLAEDERAASKSAEQAEARLVPLVRSIDNALLATDALALLAQVPAPVRFVIGTEDRFAPATFIAEQCDARDGFELLRPEGDRTLAYTRPVDAITAIEPGDPDALALAQHVKPVPPAQGRSRGMRLDGSLEATILRTGILNLIAAVVVVLLHPIREEVVTVGFALWVAIASVSAIVGAVSMRKKTASTRFTFTTTALPTLLVGLAGLAIASTLFADPALGRQFFGVIVAVYAMARGAADLYVALRVKDAAKPRWLLYAGAVLGIGTALAIVFGPNHGRGIVRLSLALYLGLTGVSLVAYAVSVRRGAKRRMRELLGR